MSNWYKISQNIEQSPAKQIKIPPVLMGLAAEARKCSTFEEFEQNYIGQIKHGLYWHLTENPNFQIDLNKGPRDMSSMGTGQVTPGALMITSNIDDWLSYGNRQYAAQIDMSNVPAKDYYQVNRGFGNEFYVTNPSMAKVVRVIPIKNAIKIDKYHHSKSPNSSQSLKEFYDKVKKTP